MMAINDKPTIKTYTEWQTAGFQRGSHGRIGNEPALLPPQQHSRYAVDPCSRNVSHPAALLREQEEFTHLPQQGRDPGK